MRTRRNVKAKKGKKAGSGGFLVEHVEKLVFGFFALVVLLCVVGAMQHEPYKKTPQQLEDILRSKENAVAQNDPATFAALKDKTVTEFDTMVKNGPQVSAEEAQRRSFLARASSGQADPSYVPQQKRGEPEYLPIVGLKVFPRVITIALLGEGQKVAANNGGAVGGVPVGLEPGRPPAGIENDEAGAKKPPRGRNKGRGKGRGQPGEGLFEGEIGGGGDEPGVAGGDVPPPMGGGHDGIGVQRRRPGVQAPADSISKGFFVAVVTGSLPREKQAELYRQTFEFAARFNEAEDVPKYFSFLIQRADVTAGREPTEQDWKNGIMANTSDGRAFVSFVQHSWELQQKWVFPAPEIVDSTTAAHVLPLVVTTKKNAQGKEYVEWSMFTQLLPPLLGEDWGKEVAGGFPLLSDRKEQYPDEGGMIPGGPIGPGGGVDVPPGIPGAGGQPGETVPGAGGQPGETVPGSLPPGYPTGKPPTRRRGQFRGPPAGGNKTPPSLPPGYPMGNSGSPSVAPGIPPGGNPSVAPGVAPGGMGPGIPGGGNPHGNPFDLGPGGGPHQVPGGAGGVQFNAMADVLFRFFDFSIEEGRRYRYRVMLILDNPNFGKNPAMLKQLALASGQYRFSPWSAPTDVVTVSGFSEVLAGAVRPGRPEGGTADVMSLLIRQRDGKTGAVITHPFNRIQAGQRIDMSVAVSDVVLAHPVHGAAVRLKDLDAFKSDPRTRSARYAFQSGDLVLDLVGDRTKPGEMLMLDSTGFLTVRSEVEDSSANYAEQMRLLLDLHQQLSGGTAEIGDDAGFDDFFNPGGKIPKPQGKGLPPGYGQPGEKPRR